MEETKKWPQLTKELLQCIRIHSTKYDGKFQSLITNPWIEKPVPLWADVVLNPIQRTIQSETIDEKHQKDEIRQGCSYVNHLRRITWHHQAPLTQLHSYVEWLNSVSSENPFIKPNDNLPWFRNPRTLHLYCNPLFKHCFTQLSCCTDTLPYTKVNHDPCNKQAQCKLPIHRSRLFNSRT